MPLKVGYKFLQLKGNSPVGQALFSLADTCFRRGNAVLKPDMGYREYEPVTFEVVYFSLVAETECNKTLQYRSYIFRVSLEVYSLTAFVGLRDHREKTHPARQINALIIRHKIISRMNCQEILHLLLINRVLFELKICNILFYI